MSAATGGDRDDHRAVVVELTRRGPHAVAGDERHVPPRRAASLAASWLDDDDVAALRPVLDQVAP